MTEETLAVSMHALPFHFRATTERIYLLDGISPNVRLTTILFGS